MSINPQASSKRSLLYRQHQQAGATFDWFGECVAVSHYGDADKEIEQARQLAMADLSTFARIGFKGAGAIDWLIIQGVKIPAAPNQAVLQSGGALAARLSEQEILLVDKLTGSDLLLPQLEQHYDINACPQTYVLPRADSHSCFAVTGRFAERMFAKVCGVDLRANSFATGQVAQTSLARVNGIIIRQDSGTVPFFWVLSDISSSEFLWTCLLDAMTEFSGAPIGIPALQALTQD